MKKNNLLLFSIFIFLINFNYLKAQDNIAFIDLNYIFDNSNAGKKIIKQIQDQQKKK